MTELDSWLKQAARNLSRESAAQVCTEIHDHYESAREAAMSGGAGADEADRAAVASLGDAKAANRQYRTVLLTAAEAKMIRDVQWEAKAVCARPWLLWLLRAFPVAALCAATIAFASGHGSMARFLFLAGVATGVFAAAPTLPLYTQRRARIFRSAKWIVIVAATALAFGRNALEWAGALAVCAVGFAWTEWMRHSIRQKLPVADWPKQLYL